MFVFTAGPAAGGSKGGEVVFPVLLGLRAQCAQTKGILSTCGVEDGQIHYRYLVLRLFAKPSAYLKNFLYSVKNCAMGLMTLLDPFLLTSVFIGKKCKKCNVRLNDDRIHGSKV